MLLYAFILAKRQQGGGQDKVYLDSINPTHLSSTCHSTTSTESINTDFSKSPQLNKADSINQVSSQQVYNTESKEPILLDFGGGSGLLVRLLRDVGLESYWIDAYCENMFARGFEWHDSAHLKPSLATCFEVFEHLLNPLDSIRDMLEISPNLLFSTQLLPCAIPQYCGDKQWWYYGFSHGQHISFYTRQSLEHIAKIYKLHFVSCGDIHCFSVHKIHPKRFAFIVKMSHRGLFALCKRRFTSKTMSDSLMLSRTL